MNTIRTTAALVACVVIAACASVDPPRRYVPKTNDAKLNFRSVNLPSEVTFSVSADPRACEGFEHVGTVSGQVLVPANPSHWTNRIPPHLEARVPAGKEVQVKGLGGWFDAESLGLCGPLAGKFVPAESASYLIEFIWSGTSACSMRISNVTVSNKPEPVPAQRLACTRG
jgi:hypothetical protein